MKTLTVLLLMLVTLPVFSQTFGLNADTGLLTYEEVINADSLKAEDIYNKVKEWAIETFNNADKVIVGDNKPTLVKARFIQEYFNGMGHNADYYNTMTVKIKDGALKVTIDQMQMTSGFAVEGTVFKKDGTQRTGQTYQKIYEDIEAKCKALVQNLSDAVNKKSDW